MSSTENNTSSISEEHSEVRRKLERKLSLRPEKQELLDRNILKESNAAPAIQGAQAELQRSQLEDKLERAIRERPKAEVLVKEGILKEDETPLSA